MADVSAEELVQNVEKSSGTCLKVLSYLAESLEKGGFSANSKTYMQMAETIINQKGWCAGNATPSIMRNFTGILEKAVIIRDGMEPYVKIMNRLVASLSAYETGERACLSGNAGPQTHPEHIPETGKTQQNLEEKIVAALTVRKGKVSLSVLCGALGVERSVLTETLKKLQEHQVVKCINQGGREQYYM